MRFLLGYVMQWSFLHAWLFRCYASELVGSCRCVHHGCCCCCSLNRFHQWTITADISSRLTSCCVLVFSCYILLRFLHSSFSVQCYKHCALLLASCNQVAELAIQFFSFRLQKQRSLNFQSYILTSFSLAYIFQILVDIIVCLPCITRMWPWRSRGDLLSFLIKK